MATERKAPDAIISSAGLDVSGGVSAVQDDPDSPDANWFTSSASNGSLRLSFPTPTGSPNTGAGLQEFRVQMRKDASGGSDPTYTAELRETGGGAALQTLATDVAITTADPGEVESLTWDAANLATADGSAVELLLTLSKAGGGPNERNIEIGAAEWNVDYSTAQQFAITGDVTVTPAVAATMDYDRNVSITGDVTVPVTVAATTQYQKNASITGDVTVPLTVAATMQYSGGNSFAVTGDVTVSASVGAGLQYQRNASVQGDVTVSPAVASVMDYDLNASLAADVQLQLTVSAAMQYSGNPSIAGDVTLSLTPSATLHYSGSGEGGEGACGGYAALGTLRVLSGLRGLRRRH